MDSYEKSLQTLELPAVLALLAAHDQRKRQAENAWKHS